MLGNFSYSNPTKLYFGEESLCSLNEELPKYGKTVQLIYGGGSIKKNGIYNQVMRLLKDNGKVVVEDGGVMPNPTVEKLREGVRIARENHVDFLLAVGGGSCCDYAKAVSVSVHCDEDPWEKYYMKVETSVDGKDWNTVTDCTKDGISGSPVSIPVAGECKFVRLAFAVSEGNAKPSVWELLFY